MLLLAGISGPEQRPEVQSRLRISITGRRAGLTRREPLVGRASTSVRFFLRTAICGGSKVRNTMSGAPIGVGANAAGSARNRAGLIPADQNEPRQSASGRARTSRTG